MCQRAYVSRSAEVRLTWEEAQDRVHSYVAGGSYLAEGEVPLQVEDAGMYQQLSLFPDVEEQVGNIAVAEAGMKHTMSAAFSVPEGQIEQHVRSMVEQGTYMSSSEAFLVDESERSRIANHIYFFFRDGIEESPEELHINNSNFPDSHASLTNMLSERGGIDTIAAYMDAAMEQIETGEKKLRFSSVVSPKELHEGLDNLKADYREFPQADIVEVRQEDCHWRARKPTNSIRKSRHRNPYGKHRKN